MEGGGAFKRSEVIHKLKPFYSEEVLNDRLLSGGSRFENRINWAFSHLKKAEFIELSTNEKFSYIITELGKKALEDAKNGKKIDVAYLKNNSDSYEINWKSKTKLKENLQNEEEEEEIDLAEECNIRNSATGVEFLNQLRKLDWKFFEDFCAKLLEKMNYGVASKREIRQKDGGIDGVIYTDELGIKDKIYIQAKKYDNLTNVTAPKIREFLHILNTQNSKGVFITTSKFTKDALMEAEIFRKQGQIALIDDAKLLELCIKYKHGLKVKEILEVLESNL